MITHILLRIEHTKPLPDLLDLAAGRVYTLDGVSDVTAGLVEERQQVERYILTEDDDQPKEIQK